MDDLKNNWHQAYEDLSSRSISKSMQYGALTVIVLLTLWVRLETINTPQLQWTRWKEIDYIAISQNYLKDGFNFFWPEVTWPAEPPRVTEMEFPLVPYTAAILYKFFGFNAYTARGVTLFSSLLMIVYVFKLTKRELGAFPGLVAALAAAGLPLYHPFSRFLFTEPTMIAFSVVSLYYLAEWVDYERRKDWIFALVSFSLTVALKLEVLYIFLPVAWIAYRKYRFEVNRYKRIFILLVLAMILPVLWYSYAYYLEKIGAHIFGIFEGHDKSQTFSMLTKYLWYRTMASRIVSGILGGFYGAILFIIGLVAAARFRKAGLFFAYLASVGIYFAIIAEGNIDAPYRQLPIIPPAAVFVALGVQVVVATAFAIYQTFLKGLFFQSSYSYVALMTCLVLVVIIPILNYKDIFYADIPSYPDRWDLAQVIKNISSDQTKMIVIGESDKHLGGYDLSPILYYYADRQGWTLEPVDWNMDKIEELRSKGAGLLVVVPRYDSDPSSLMYQFEESPDTIINELRARYPVVYQNQDHIIFDLKSPIK